MLKAEAEKVKLVAKPSANWSRQIKTTRNAGLQRAKTKNATSGTPGHLSSMPMVLTDPEDMTSC